MLCACFIVVQCGVGLCPQTELHSFRGREVGLTHFNIMNTLLAGVVLLSDGQQENFGTGNEML